MTDIPEDVRRAAKAVFSGGFPTVQSVAEAILAERERAAKLAEMYAFLQDPGLQPRDHETLLQANAAQGAALNIVYAIRNPVLHPPATRTHEDHRH